MIFKFWNDASFTVRFEIMDHFGSNKISIRWLEKIFIPLDSRRVLLNTPRDRETDEMKNAKVE